ncbi:MAG: hypothetical protein WCW03_00365 [Candidatus Paceibacterota bacterium]|jgi:flagellar basal body-associated protein FliL
MEKNVKMVLLVLIIILSCVFIFFYSFQSKSSLPSQSPQPNKEKTEEQIMQVFTDSIAPTTATTSLDIQESKELIDSIAPRDNKIIKTINN